MLQIFYHTMTLPVLEAPHKIAREEGKKFSKTLHEKCPYLELFWSVFSLNAKKIRTRITPNTDTFYAVKNTNVHQKNSQIFCREGFEQLLAITCTFLENVTIKLLKN